MQSQLPHLPVRIIIRLREWPDEDQDMATAFSKRPSEVRDALLEAIREVELRSTDIALLRIEDIFQAGLKQPWKEPRNFRSILEAGCQGKLKETEARFYKYGQQYGVGALSAATKANPSLFGDIDALPDEELAKLIGNIMKRPWKSAITDVIEEFEQTQGQVYISDHTPKLTRPRKRRKLESSTLLRSPTPLSNVNESKRRRSLSPPITSIWDTRTQNLFQSPQLPAPLIHALSSPIHSPFETRQMDFGIGTESQPLLGQTSGQGTNRPRICHDQESQESGQEGGWTVPANTFIPGRPQWYHDKVAFIVPCAFLTLFLQIVGLSVIHNCGNICNHVRSTICLSIPLSGEGCFAGRVELPDNAHSRGRARRRLSPIREVSPPPVNFLNKPTLERNK